MQDITKREYQKLMTEIDKDDLPRGWIQNAVVDIFGKTDSINLFNKRYSMISNVRLGRSYAQGKKLGIIQYIVDKAEKYSGKRILQRQ